MHSRHRYIQTTNTNKETAKIQNVHVVESIQTSKCSCSLIFIYFLPFFLNTKKTPNENYLFSFLSRIASTLIDTYIVLINDQLGKHVLLLKKATNHVHSIFLFHLYICKCECTPVQLHWTKPPTHPSNRFLSFSPHIHIIRFIRVAR